MRNVHVDRYFTQMGKNPEFEASEEGENRSNNAYARMSAKFRKAENWGYDVTRFTVVNGRVVMPKKDTNGRNRNAIF